MPLPVRSAVIGSMLPDEPALAKCPYCSRLVWLPDAEEVARVAVFLASQLSNPVTGHLLDANAGQWM